jgi:WD40 repeat protein
LETQVLKTPKPFVLPSAAGAILPLQVTPLGEPYLLTAHANLIRIYDLTTFDEPEVVKDLDGHWHTVSGLRFWPRSREDDVGRISLEPWILSTSLDGTLRRWKVKGALYRDNLL